MIRKKAINSVFPDLNDKIKLEPFILGTNEVFYDQRVKISNWHDRYLREPLDNTEFFPPKGHLRMATYKKLGTYGPQNYLTETREEFKERKPEDFQKSSKPVQMLNIFSFSLDDIADEKIKLEIERKYPLENIPKLIPESLYRRTLGYSSEDVEKLKGMRTFLDDDLEVHAKISNLKMKRYNR